MGPLQLGRLFCLDLNYDRNNLLLNSRFVGYEFILSLCHYLTNQF